MLFFCIFATACSRWRRYDRSPGVEPDTGYHLWTHALRQPCV